MARLDELGGRMLQERDRLLINLEKGAYRGLGLVEARRRLDGLNGRLNELRRFKRLMEEPDNQLPDRQMELFQ
ncbi:MAG: hypothetical protein WC350_06065 [Candidatus Micrarchaeia archaeon]|jgi:hypothetical protein